MTLFHKVMGLWGYDVNIGSLELIILAIKSLYRILSTHKNNSNSMTCNIFKRSKVARDLVKDISYDMQTIRKPNGFR